ncbi:MAG: hypothetical protein AB7F75_05955 [Planctomycetota bacterium]
MEDVTRQRLRDILQAQLEVYKRMRSLMRSQREALTLNDSARLIGLMEEAADMKIEAESLQVRADPLRLEWEQARDEIPELERTALRSLMEEIRSTLGEVLSDMNDLQDDVGRRRDETSEKLRDLGRSVAGRRGYGLPTGQGSKHLDRDG